MAVKKKKSHRKRRLTIPLALAAGFAPGAVVLSRQKSLEAAGKEASRIYLGWDVDKGDFWARRLQKGLFPIFAGALVHRAANMVGINRALAAAGVPVLRV